MVSGHCRIKSLSLMLFDAQPRHQVLVDHLAQSQLEYASLSSFTARLHIRTSLYSHNIQYLLYPQMEAIPRYVQVRNRKCIFVGAIRRLR